MNKWDCLNVGGEWQNQYYNFDNVGLAILSLFILSNVSGWENFMYTSAQVTQVSICYYSNFLA